MKDLSVDRKGMQLSGARSPVGSTVQAMRGERREGGERGRRERDNCRELSDSSTETLWFCLLGRFLPLLSNAVVGCWSGHAHQSP